MTSEQVKALFDRHMAIREIEWWEASLFFSDDEIAHSGQPTHTHWVYAAVPGPEMRKMPKTGVAPDELRRVVRGAVSRPTDKVLPLIEDVRVMHDPDVDTYYIKLPVDCVGGQ